MEEEFSFSYEAYNSIDELQPGDAALLKQARETTVNAYAPYSNFHVAAVASLTNGELVSGTNQENASYPVGTCAERATLAVASSLFPNVAIETMAITYDNINGKSDSPVSPCGMCRQALVEHEGRVHHPIRLILSGKEGKVYIIQNAKQLLPFSFSSEDMG